MATISPLLQFRVLGPLEVLGADQRPVDLGSPKLRALLSVLLIQPGHVVALDRICAQLWGDDPPAAATGTVQAYVSQLRRTLEPNRKPREPAAVVITRPPGYAVAVGEGQLDAARLEALVRSAESSMAAGELALAETDLLEARGLWRGRPFAEVADEPFAHSTVVRLEQLHLLAIERHMDVLLGTGRAGTAVAELERLVRDHPLRERFWGQLVEALYRGGRQADALRAYQACRERLADELGIEPGPELQRLERAVLEHDPALLAVTTLPRSAPTPTPAATEPPPGPPAVTLSPQGRPGVVAAPAEPLVGRVHERRVLEDVVRAAGAGRGHVVVVEGEAGIGKTRLAEAALELAAGHGIRTTWTACIDQIGAPPLWPWRQALRSLTGADAKATDVGPIEGEDQDAARFRVLAGLVDELVDAVAGDPALIVIDDLQWADAASMQLLRVLIHRLAGTPLVVVATARRPDMADPAQLDETLADLARHREATRLVLRGLAEADVADLVHEMTGADGHALAPLLHDRTGGNPFFCAELLRLLQSEARLQGHASAGDLERALPATVRDVVERRVARLPDDTRTMLRLAAVAGPTVELAVLERVAELDADRVVDLLEPAVLTGLVLELTDGFGWRFPHAIVQDAVRASLGGVQQARLHAAVARAIADAHHGHLALHLDALAHHSWAGARVAGADDALGWSRAAAEAARDAYGYDRAALHWGHALELAGLVGVDDAERLDLLIELGQALRLSGDVLTARARLVEATQLATARGDREGLRRAARVFGGVSLWNWAHYGEVDPTIVGVLDGLLAGELDERHRAELEGTLGVELYYGPRREEGVGHARRAVARARAVGDVALRAQTLNNLVVALHEPGHGPERMALLDEAIDLPGLPPHAEAIARVHRAAIALRDGDLGRVEEDLARCGVLVVEASVPEIAAQVTYARGGLAMLWGRWDEAQRLADQAYEAQLRTNVWGADWCRHVQLAVIRSAQGRIGEMVDQMVAEAEMPGMAALRCSAVAGLAEAGDHAGARLLAERWFPIDPPPDWSYDYRTTAWAAAAARVGVPDRATMYERLLPFEDKLVVAGTAVACRGSSGLVLGRLAKSMGRIDDARRHWEVAAARNRALGAHWWADRAQAELDAL